MNERDYYLGFSVFPGVGPILFQALLERFGTADVAWCASDKDLEDVLKNKLTVKFVKFRDTFSLQEYVNTLESKKVSFLTLGDKEYPQLLKKIKNPPFVLFVKGNIDIFCRSKNNLSENTGQERCIGVVGTRKMTSYGHDVTRVITSDLVAAGCTIVSGLALGVDAIAHGTTLSQNGKTIAVLGCGVDLCYPTANRALYDAILSNAGAIVSEYPPGQQPTVGSFPARNRIIAGLSDAVVVTEGAEDSGALITAEHAIQEGRKVFAVPGEITSHLARGPLKLLQEGATMVTCGDDIMSALGISTRVRASRTRITGDTKEEKRIVEVLEKEEYLFDELLLELDMSAKALSMTLSLMELKGKVKNVSGKYTLSEE
ncbi:MAG: hypothetical protein RLZZ455_1112 [Candidatus Parcubacteria bacterium]|jgi:DNA processing protein